jgi:hypothetical protein
MADVIWNKLRMHTVYFNSLCVDILGYKKKIWDKSDDFF